MINLRRKATEETQLNALVRRQRLVGGKATTRTSGTRVVRNGVVYGEYVTHGRVDDIDRYIAIVTGDNVDEYSDTTGWRSYTLTKARGI